MYKKQSLKNFAPSCDCCTKDCAFPKYVQSETYKFQSILSTQKIINVTVILISISRIYLVYISCDYFSQMENIFVVGSSTCLCHVCRGSDMKAKLIRNIESVSFNLM